MALTNQERADAANSQIAQFEAERYAHELVLARLNGIPSDLRDPSWAPAVRTSLQALDIIDASIAATKAACQSAEAGDPIVDVDALRAEVAE